MAQKKITDLQLRSSFDSTCNIPVDDTTQTWRVTGAQIMDFLNSGHRSPSGLYNFSLSAGVSANALTIAVKRQDGTSDPSTANPAYVEFRSSTATSGLFNLRSITGAVSLVIPSGATLGHTSAMNQYVWVYLMDNGGTVELAVSGVKLFTDKSIASSTAISAAATSGTVLYSTTGRTNLPIRLVGRLLVSEATAGTWATAPSDLVIAPTPTINVTPFGETEWTPTGSWVANTTYTGIYKREGDIFIGRVKVATSGAPTSTALVVNLPFTIDTSKLTSTTTGAATRLGGGTVADFGVNIYDAFVTFNSTTAVNIYVGNAAGTYSASASPVTDTIPMSFGATDYAEVEFRVPILGWSIFGP